jgi:hypothetical protein
VTLLFLALGLPGFGASTIKTVWTCSIPCESDSIPQVDLKWLNIGWCGVTALDRAMMDKMTQKCRELNHTEKAHAVRQIKSPPAVSSCVTSASGCQDEGLIYVGYNCRIMCEGEEFPTLYTVCARDNFEAWGLAPKICRNPTPPFMTPIAGVCDPHGESQCTP